MSELAAVNVDRIIPEHFLILDELARRAGTTPKSLRKHQIPGWKEKRLAIKDVRGFWFVDPAVIGSFEVHGPVKKSSDRDPLLPGVGGDGVQRQGDVLSFRWGDGETRFKCRILVDSGTQKFAFEGKLLALDIDQLPASNVGGV